MTKEQRMLEAVKAASNEADTMQQLSNMVFDQETGIISKEYPTIEERRAFVQSPEYKEIKRILNSKPLV